MLFNSAKLDILPRARHRTILFPVELSDSHHVMDAGRIDREHWCPRLPAVPVKTVVFCAYVIPSSLLSYVF